MPPARLGDYLRAFDDLLEEHDVQGLPYGHFGDGCIHVRLDIPLEQDGSALRSLMEDAGRLVAKHGIVQTAMFQNSPMRMLFEGAGAVRQRLDLEGVEFAFPLFYELRDQGLGRRLKARGLHGSLKIDIKTNAALATLPAALRD